ncbi:hypothetical protein ACFYOK_29455 [Microbispora bryophytorum]|uniref:hypothetical protein n=1 Tax=Microbispora bryophytorum TaxID=1460882 RepID=UPI0033C0EE21
MSSELEELRTIAEAAVVRPGDTLVLRAGADATLIDLERFRDQALPLLQQRLPGVEVLLIYGVEQLVVHRPNEDTGLSDLRDGGA